MLWVENGLINKLIQNGVAEKHQDSIRFTKSFYKFVMKRLHGEMEMQTPEECRRLLCEYGEGLEMISYDQACATMVIFDFYYDQLEAAIPDGR